MTGIEYQLIRPLDFVVVADHAESYGLLDFIARSGPLISQDPLGKQLTIQDRAYTTPIWYTP